MRNSLLNTESKFATENVHPKESFIRTGTISFLQITKECFLYSPMQHQCFPADMHLVLVTKQRLSVSVIESLDALLRQDLEDQGGLEDLVDHLHHLCLVDLVDPRVKKTIIKWTLEVAKEISEVINSLTTRDLQHTLQQFYICSCNKRLTLENKYSLNLHCLATPHIRYLL